MTMLPAGVTLAGSPWIDRTRAGLPGLLLTAIVALAAAQIAAWQGGPVMLYALLLGMLCHGMVRDGHYGTGVQWTTKPVLRVGVALLGVKVTLADMMGLGISTVLVTISALLVTIGGGYLISRWLRLSPSHALLSAGAVAICGASAALAIAAALPARQQAERTTLLVVVGVTALSTLAMLAYPLLVRAVGFNDIQAGIFFGATIHDVAQVVGAGYLISDQAAETAAIVKLMRVACLVPVVLAVGLVFRDRQDVANSATPPALPFFLLGFLALMAANSAGLIPGSAVVLLGDLSRGCLVLAVAGLGLKTSLPDLLATGPRPVAALVGTTMLLAAFAMGVLLLIG